MNPKAAFLAMPRCLYDLRLPMSPEKWHPYTIEKTVVLPRSEYSNFTEDMVHWRSFIEDNAHLCRVDENGIWHCVLVQAAGYSDGVLIMTDGEHWTKYAAYYANIRLS